MAGIPDWVIDRQAIAMAHVGMAAVLWSYVSGDAIKSSTDGLVAVWPSQATLSRRTGVSRTGVYRSLRALEDHGVIARKGREIRAGQRVEVFYLRLAPVRERNSSVASAHGGVASTHSASTQHRRCANATETLRRRNRNVASSQHRTTQEPPRNHPEEPPSADGGVQPLLVPQEHQGPDRYEQVARALYSAKQRAWAGTDRRVRRLVLAGGQRKLVDRILREHKLDDLLTALRRKGEDAYRRPTYRRRENGRWVEHSNRKLVSLAHLVRGTNLVNLLDSPELDDPAPAHREVADDGSFLRDTGMIKMNLDAEVSL